MVKNKPQDVLDLENELQQIMTDLRANQKSVRDKQLEEICGDMSPVISVKLNFRRALKGHLQKVNAIHFSGDSRHLVSAALESKLIIWDTITGNKTKIIGLRSSWTMTCAFATSGNMVACGGMDNMCSVYDLNKRDCDNTGAKLVRELAGFDGFLSCCRFVDDNNLITGSADKKIVLWDIETGSKVKEFRGHTGDVISCAISHDSSNLITGSVDKTAKLWDLRTDKPVQTFFGHEADVTSVNFHRSDFVFSTGSEDRTCRLFDIRSDQEITAYKSPNSRSGFTSCALSLSGRILLAGSDDSTIHMWDILKSKHAGNLSGHESRVSTISLTPDGMALASGSWDTTIRVWV
ncbi:guanine nucleotide-binding protein subunit beta-2-like [Panonychus citri]|uniref:guanine nucleotide-binding protein subunit beta-2-like n=1 Tax=Panonychus citri TaxID=50023 RepID=UPI0023080F3D|nr:guanine nucleotide-binding protein subunit beta-2-like [Panonychus citri]